MKSLSRIMVIGLVADSAGGAIFLVTWDVPALAQVEKVIQMIVSRNRQQDRFWLVPLFGQRLVAQDPFL